MPDEVRGLGPLRNWILDHYQEEIVVMADDDIKRCISVTRESPYNITDPADIERIIVNAGLMARDLGATIFGFNSSWDVRKFRVDRPFYFDTWVGGIIGVVGRKRKFLQHHLFKVDIDYCLEGILNERVIWKDDRFGFVQIRDRNRGGNAQYRTASKVAREVEFLKRKWGSHLDWKETKSGVTPVLKVARRDQFLAGQG